MKYLIILAMLCIIIGGCRVGFYGAIGPQEVDKVELKLIKLKADPNMPAIVGAAVKAAIGGGKWKSKK